MKQREAARYYVVVDQAMGKSVAKTQHLVRAIEACRHPDLVVFQATGVEGAFLDYVQISGLYDPVIVGRSAREDLEALKKELSRPGRFEVFTPPEGARPLAGSDEFPGKVRISARGHSLDVDINVVRELVLIAQIDLLSRHASDPPIEGEVMKGITEARLEEVEKILEVIGRPE